MRTRWFLGASVCLALACPPAHAGLYIPAKPAPWPLPTNPNEYLRELRELQSLVSTEPSVLKQDFPKRAREDVAELEGRRRAGKLSVEDGLNLGGYYILQAKYNQAIDVLT